MFPVPNSTEFFTNCFIYTVNLTHIYIRIIFKCFIAQVTFKAFNVFSFFPEMSRQIGVKRQKYAPEILDHAAELVRSKSLSLNEASRKYCVPLTTLHNAVHNKYGGHKVGHKTILSEVEEQRIADWTLHMARIGYGRTRQELANTEKRILGDDERKTPFRDNRPGR